MLRIDKQDDTITFVSDDKAAENQYLQDAIEEGAPHLLDAYEKTEVGDDGLLKFSVARDDWSSVLEIIDLLEVPFEPVSVGAEIEGEVRSA